MGKNKKWKRQAKRIVGECNRNRGAECEAICSHMGCIEFDLDNIRNVELSIKARNNLLKKLRNKLNLRGDIYGIYK